MLNTSAIHNRTDLVSDHILLLQYVVGGPTVDGVAVLAPPATGIAPLNDKLSSKLSAPACRSIW